LQDEALFHDLLTMDGYSFLKNNNFCPIVLSMNGNRRIYDFCPMGCFAADTQILGSVTGDTEASYAPASMFNLQSTLMSMTDEASLNAVTLTTRPVERFVHGPEEPPLFVFKLTNGSTLRVTQHHPMVLHNGQIIEAAKVDEHMTFVGVDGKRVAITSITREKAIGDVFNFQTAGDTQLSHIIVAEGVLVGDLKLQNDLAYEQQSINLRR
jgi:hypothetical protein